MTDAEKAEMIINDAEVIAGGTKFALMVMADWKQEQIIEEACKWLESRFPYMSIEAIQKFADDMRKL